MDLKTFKPKGSIGIGAVYARFQENPDKAFEIAFVRSTEGENEPKGSICVRVVRYGAPPRDMGDGRLVIGDGRLVKGRTKKVSKHDAAGTIPVHYEGTKEYRSILVSHILIFDGYLVNY
jgi:hypothetical protein